MAIPNLAPGYMNQVQASRARALEAQRRLDFERDENRKAMERGIAQAFLGAALDVGTGAAKTAASEALLKPERERKRAHETAMQKDRLDLQEYGYDASSVDATGAAIAKVTGYDDDLARDAIVGMRRALNPAAVRGAGKATPVAPGARPLAPTAGTTPPQRGDRRIGIVTDAKAPVEIGPPVAAADDGSLKRGGPPLMGPPVEAADQDRLKEAIRRATILGNRGAESPTPAVSEPALQKKAGFPSVVDTAPRRVARRGAEAPSGRVVPARQAPPAAPASVPARQAPAAAPASAPAAAPYDSGYEEAPGGFNPQAEMRRSLRPTASEFASERDRKLFAREQAFRRGAEAKALATALKRQDELMKRRGERTEFWDEYARKQADSLWNNQDKLDAMQDASKALANSQFERGVINVSLREWLQAFPPEDRDRVRASLPENMQEVLRRGQSMIVERPVTPDMIKRYNQLFANAIARKTKKGRTGGAGVKIPIAGRPEVDPVGLYKHAGSGVTIRLEAFKPKEIKALVARAETAIGKGDQGTFRTAGMEMVKYLNDAAKNGWNDANREGYSANHAVFSKLLNKHRGAIGKVIADPKLDSSKPLTPEQKAASERKSIVQQSGHWKGLQAAESKQRSLAIDRVKAIYKEFNPGVPLETAVNKVQVPDDTPPLDPARRKAAMAEKNIRAAYKEWDKVKSGIKRAAWKSYVEDNPGNKELIGVDIEGGVGALRKAYLGGQAAAPEKRRRLRAPAPAQPTTPQIPPPARRRGATTSEADVERRMEQAFADIQRMDLPASVKRRMFDDFTRRLGVA
jgi:hypothetical protein